MMRRLFSCGLTLLLASGVPRAEESGCELHLSKVGEVPDFIGLRILPDGPALRLEVAQDHLVVAHALPKARRAMLKGEPSEAGQPPISIGEITLPESGRHLLLLTPKLKSGIRTTLIPADAKQFPVGSVGFLNLTSRSLRCFIDKEYIELPTGETKIHPSVSTERRIVNHRLQVSAKGKWVSDGSTTLILGANRRCLFVLTEDEPNGVIRRGLVTDFDPDRNLATLVKPEPPVTATPPPADQPAK
jgi:hypothetical protein